MKEDKSAASNCVSNIRQDIVEEEENVIKYVSFPILSWCFRLSATIHLIAIYCRKSGGREKNPVHHGIQVCQCFHSFATFSIFLTTVIIQVQLLFSAEADSKVTRGICRSLNRPTRSIVCSILTSQTCIVSNLSRSNMLLI